MMRNFFRHRTVATENYTLSLHDALPILGAGEHVLHAEHEKHAFMHPVGGRVEEEARDHLIIVGKHRENGPIGDRKSTRLNSSHVSISYAVFCLKKKNNMNIKQNL